MQRHCLLYLILFMGQWISWIWQRAWIAIQNPWLFWLGLEEKVNIPQCCCKRISNSRYLGLGFRRNVFGWVGEMTFCILRQLGVFLKLNLVSSLYKDNQKKIQLRVYIVDFWAFTEGQLKMLFWVQRSRTDGVSTVGRFLISKYHFMGSPKSFRVWFHS